MRHGCKRLITTSCLLFKTGRLQLFRSYTVTNNILLRRRRRDIALSGNLHLSRPASHKSPAMTELLKLPLAFPKLTVLDGAKHNWTEGASAFDTILVVSPAVDLVSKFSEKLAKPLMEYLQVHKGLEKGGPTLIVTSGLPTKKLIYSPTGRLDKEFDDVRGYRNATLNGLELASSSGSKKVLLACCPCNRFPEAVSVSMHALLDFVYLPADVRTVDCQSRLDACAVLGFDHQAVIDKAKQVEVINEGKIVMKDIGGGEPEQATPIGVKYYVQKLFNSTDIHVSVVESKDLVTQFPLLAAVDRATLGNEDHQGCLIKLEYNVGAPGVKETLFLVGKGITYDTGGADLKVGGAMIGMSNDKGGAATVAGFFQILSKIKPKNLAVVGLMAMARNDIGPNAYVSDELIQTRSGVKICVGNTDAEGRMAMADPLCLAKELAQSAINPIIFTLATLTGHVVIAYGNGYTAVVENGRALEQKIGETLRKIGWRHGDPVEQSFLRKEDYDFVSYKGKRADLMQCNNLPSSRTPRGHIFPAAFLIRASGMDKHGLDSAKPIPYAHLDIAGAIEQKDKFPFLDHPRAAMLTTIANRYVFSEK